MVCISLLDTFCVIGICRCMRVYIVLINSSIAYMLEILIWSVESSIFLIDTPRFEKYGKEFFVIQMLGYVFPSFSNTLYLGLYFLIKLFSSSNASSSN